MLAGDRLSALWKHGALLLYALQTHAIGYTAMLS